MFWRFSIIVSSLPSASLTAGHDLQRSTLHAPSTRAAILRDQRGRVVRRPSPAGYCLAPTANCQRPNGARSRRAIPLFQYATKPGDSCGQINPFFLARRRPTVDHSLVAGGAQRQSLQSVPAGWPYGAMPVLCLLSLISRNSTKQLGMVSPELLAVTRSALPSPLYY